MSPKQTISFCEVVRVPFGERLRGQSTHHEANEGIRKREKRENEKERET